MSYVSATCSGSKVWNSCGPTSMYEEVAGLWFCSYTLVSSLLSTLFSPLSAVQKVSFYPVADLSIFERGYSHCYIEFLRCPLSLYPLMPRKDAYHLPLPTPVPPIPHSSVDSRAAGPRLSITVLVQQVWCLLAGPTESIHQLTWTIIIKSWEVDPLTRQPLSRGADSYLHVSAFVGFLEFKQSIVIVHSNVIGIPFNPSFGNVSAFGSDPLKLHFIIGWWGIRNRDASNIVGEVGRIVKGRGLYVSLLGF